MANSNSPLDCAAGGAADQQVSQENETKLLLAMLDLALTNIKISETIRDKSAATLCLTRAVDTYGSVKGLLPKLTLLPEQVALVHERLEAVRRRLWTGPVKPAEGG